MFIGGTPYIPMKVDQCSLEPVLLPPSQFTACTQWRLLLNQLTSCHGCVYEVKGLRTQTQTLRQNRSKKKDWIKTVLKLADLQSGIKTASDALMLCWCTNQVLLPPAGILSAYRTCFIYVTGYALAGLQVRFGLAGYEMHISTNVD